MDATIRNRDDDGAVTIRPRALKSPTWMHSPALSQGDNWDAGWLGALRC